MRGFYIFFINFLVVKANKELEIDYIEHADAYSDEGSSEISPNSAEVDNDCTNVDVKTVSETTQTTENVISTTNQLSSAEGPKSEEDSKSSPTNYPFVVSVQRKGSHYTTGALINKKWILSSAKEYYHVRETIRLFRARLGSVDCKKWGILVPLKSVEIHPSYIYGQPNFDLALLRMAQLVDFSDYVKPIGLSQIKKRVISAKFMSTYWPRLIVNGKSLSSTAQERLKQNSLRVSTQRLIPRARCLAQMEYLNITFEESTMCLKPIVTHHSICLPDAGAPIVAEDGLWGITSSWTSPDCEHNRSPTVFTRIAHPIVGSWLDTMTRPSYPKLDKA